MNRIALGCVLYAVACSSARVGHNETGAPTVTFPARITEGDAGASPREQPPEEAPTAEPPAQKTALPDPEPLRTPDQWEYTFHYARGTIRVDGVRRMRFDQPVVTARTMGRFAVELWIGRELVERVRFDFPLIAAEEVPKKRRPLEQPPSLLAGADVRIKVLVPLSDRATRAVLVDRATGQEQVLPWPPDAPLDPPSSSEERAGPSAGGERIAPPNGVRGGK